MKAALWFVLDGHTNHADGALKKRSEHLSRFRIELRNSLPVRLGDFLTSYLWKEHMKTVVTSCDVCLIF